MDLLKLSHIEINQICHFIAVTRAGNNFTKAAEYLHIQDPAPVRQRIKSLEKQLGIELFIRNGAHLQLTADRQIQELRDRRLNIGFEVATNLHEPDNRLNFLPIWEEALDGLIEVMQDNNQPLPEPKSFSFA
jgi:Bacterial regulatory helix-turn-helix protein, lysR family